MFTIKASQMEAFKKAEVEKFKKKCDEFLNLNFPDWYKDSSKLKRMILIDKIIEFGEKYEIRKEISLQKLLVFELQQKLLEKEFTEEVQEVLWQSFKREPNKMKILESVLIDLSQRSEKSER